MLRHWLLASYQRPSPAVAISLLLNTPPASTAIATLKEHLLLTATYAAASTTKEDPSPTAANLGEHLLLFLLLQLLLESSKV